MGKRTRPSTLKVPLRAFEADHDEGVGICLSCGDRNQGAGGWVEPDARNYECAFCGRKRLWGLDGALAAGRIELA